MVKEATMTITLELPPDTEAKLVAQAKARGLTLDTFVQTLIATQAAAMDPVKSLQPLPCDGEDPDRAIDELFDTVDVPPGVGQGAMHRDNWYR
jgi:hypothetical protein